MTDPVKIPPRTPSEWVSECTSLRDGIENCVWPPSQWEPILAEIGRVVFNWNCIERTTTQILNVLIGANHKAIIATAHMGTNTQLDALRTIAAEFLEGDERSHVIHAISLFERLRERRNYYVHSFDNIAQPLVGPQIPYAKLGSWSAKGRLKRHELTVSGEDLREEAITLNAAHHYFALVHNHFAHPTSPDWKTLPQKFPLPDRLTKPARFVLGE